MTSVMLHLQGGTWQESHPGLAEFLWDVEPRDDGSCYVVGPDDTLAIVR